MTLAFRSTRGRIRQRALNCPEIVGAVPPTIGDVAARAGVSIATVSRIINGKALKRASPSTIERVQAAVVELKYRPLSAGRVLRTMQSHLVALLIPDITNDFYSAIARSVELAIRQLGYAMILCNTDESCDLQDAYLEDMRSQLVRGVLLLGAVDSPGLRRAAEGGMPIIYMNRKAPPGLSGPFIGIDNYAAGQAVAEHFVRAGYRRCGAILGPMNSSATRERFEGYRDGLSKSGVELPEDAVFSGTLTPGFGYDAAAGLLRRRPRPRALFCGNDAIAYGVYRRCGELGLRVPGDVAIFGFDDNPLNGWLAPWLSTVHVPYGQFGPAVVQTLGTIAGRAPAPPADVLLPFHIQVRQSA